MAPNSPIPPSLISQTIVICGNCEREWDADVLSPQAPCPECGMVDDGCENVIRDEEQERLAPCDMAGEGHVWFCRTHGVNVWTDEAPEGCSKGGA